MNETMSKRGVAMRTAVVTLVSAGILAFGVSSVCASTEWTMVSGYADANFSTKSIRMFIEDVEKETGGELKIKLHSNGSLVKLDGIRRAVQVGQVQIGEIRLGVHSNEDPMYSLDAVPFVAPDYKSAWSLMEAQKPYFDELLEKSRLKILFYQPNPGQGFYTKTPVESTEDFKGSKLRIYSKTTQQMGEMLGFEATILPFSEIPQAFATGLIDSLFTSPQTGIDIQAWDSTKYFTFVGALYTKTAVVVNKKALSALPKDIQDIVVAAGERATKRSWQISEETLGKQMKILSEKGMVVEDAPQQVIDELKKVGETLLAEWLESASPEGRQVVETYLSKR